MTKVSLSLRIENVDQLPDGGPVTYNVDKRGLDIGRDPFMDWTLPDTQRFISGTHCHIRFENGGYWVHDVSTNGTMINSADRRITEPYQLKSGDRLFIGGYIVVAEVQLAPPAGAAPAGGGASPGDPWTVEGAAEPVDRQQFKRDAAHPSTASRPIGGDLADENIGWAMGVGDAPQTDPGELDWGVPNAAPTGGAGSTAEVDWATPAPDPAAGAAAPAPDAGAMDWGTPTPTPNSGGAAPDWAPPKPEADPTPAADPGPAQGGTPEFGAPAAPESPADAPAADWRAPPPEPGAAGATPPVGAFDAGGGSSTPPPAQGAFDAGGGPPAGAFEATPSPGAGKSDPDAGAFAPEPPAAKPAAEEAPLQLVNPVSVPAREQPAPPEPAPAPAPATGAGGFVAAFERGAGLQPGAVAAASEQAFAEELGQLFRMTAQNLQAMLLARQETKSAIRSSEVTQIGALENNPLKFSPTIEDALKVMFGEKTRSYLDAGKTLEQSFADLQKHQLYTFNAMQQALAALIKDLEPETIAGDTPKDGGLASLGSSRRAKLWDIYVERFRSKSAGHQQGMVGAFMLLFADMYDRQR